MDRIEQIQLAARLMRVTKEQAEAYSGMIPDSKALYLSIPKRGGGSLIVAEDGSVLYAGSAIGYEAHLKAFQEGKRTSLDFFE